MEKQVVEHPEEGKQQISADNNLKVKEAMAVELKETLGLATQVIGRILHLTPGEISLIFNSKAKERDRS